MAAWQVGTVPYSYMLKNQTLRGLNLCSGQTWKQKDSVKD